MLPRRGLAGVVSSSVCPRPDLAAEPVTEARPRWRGADTFLVSNLAGRLALAEAEWSPEPATHGLCSIPEQGASWAPSTNTKLSEESLGPIQHRALLTFAGVFCSNVACSNESSNETLTGMAGKNVSAFAAAARASRRMPCSLYACAIAPAGVSLPEPEGGAEGETATRLLIKLCRAVERWLPDGPATGSWLDCNGDDVDVSFRGTADMTMRFCPEVDFFLRTLGRCSNDGGGVARDFRSCDSDLDSDLDIVGGSILGLG